MGILRRVVAAIAWAGLPVALITCGGEAQERTAFEAGGYVKYMPWVTVPETAPAGIGQLLHARLNTAWYPSEEWKGTLELRFRAYAGELMGGAASAGVGAENPSLAWDLGHVFWSGNESLAYGEIDRCAITWSPPRAQVSVGRQRIAWGTNLVWNPIDVFNPFFILDFDYEERPGVDGARAQWYTGEVSKIEGAVKIGRTADELTAAGMWSFNVSEFDYRLLAGRRGVKGFVGGAWAGDILGGGFRGEVLAYQGMAWTWECAAALSGDYTFPNTLYLHAEVLFNSEGVRTGAGYARDDAAARGLLSAARFSLYQEVAMDLTPLLRGSIFAIVNPDDGSWVLVPSLNWNCADDFELMGLISWSDGEEGTEYGWYGESYVLRLRYSF
jgi:hypothetical protein